MQNQNQKTSEKQEKQADYNYNTQYDKMEVIDLLGKAYYKSNNDLILWYHYQNIKQEYFSLLKRG